MGAIQNAVALDVPVEAHPVHRQVFAQFVSAIFERLKRPCALITGWFYFVAYVPFLIVVVSILSLNTFSCTKPITTQVEILFTVSLFCYLTGFISMRTESCRRHYPGLITPFGLITELFTSIAWILLIAAARLFQKC